MTIRTSRFLSPFLLLSLITFFGVACQNQEKTNNGASNATTQTDEIPKLENVKDLNGVELELKGFKLYEKDPKEALPYFLAASEKFIQEKNKSKAARAYMNISGIYDKRVNDISKANEFANKSLKIWEELNNELQVADQLKTIGLFDAQLGNIDQGKEKLQRAIELFKKRKAFNGIADSQFNLAKACDLDGDLEQSEKYLLESTSAWESAGMNTKVFTNSLFGMRLYRKMNNEEKLQSTLQKVMETKEKIKMSAFFEQELAKTLLDVKISQ